LSSVSLSKVFEHSQPLHIHREYRSIVYTPDHCLTTVYLYDASILGTIDSTNIFWIIIDTFDYQLIYEPCCDKFMKYPDYRSSLL
jgi:hypothetical protein